MTSLIPMNEVLKGYESREFLPEELSIISDACVLIALVKDKNYIGDTHTVQQIPNDVTDSDDSKIRTSFAAAVLRNLKRQLNSLDIEE